MPVRSAGLLLFRRAGHRLEILLAHPGGPFWAKRDAGSWSVPKGELEPGEDAQAAARREFTEETGFPAPAGPVLDLGEAVQPSRKVVRVFAVEGDLDPALLRSNLVEIAWPPRSGRRLAVPEVDRIAWFALDEARSRILPGQVTFIDRLSGVLSGDEGQPACAAEREQG